MAPPRAPSGRRTAQQQLGQLGEDRALAYLLAQGLVLVERNFRCKAGEIDLIMRDGAHLVFVEVRRRAAGSFGGAAASVTAAKQQRLVHAAQFYLLRQRPLPPCRFDLVALDGDRLAWLRHIITL
ncbi:hypothetical protein ASF61_17220 [Duganella sp. Leaf126]|uniref:YraN family protein n=1 Tax=Duganella sp. Leaf126 TaxID=1736266 RepID=UPI0006F31869|nr:YraN family protein [Duganella sp. Leaf126]KQQ30975.1 hypothetical protein ASF61_17220 [Duganella sp. Leaf126]